MMTDKAVDVLSTFLLVCEGVLLSVFTLLVSTGKSLQEGRSMWRKLVQELVGSKYAFC